MESDSSLVLETAHIRARIFQIRDSQVMLDKDIAVLYEVKPIRLREQVQRNINRFPADFMFQLTETEVDFMLSQNAIPSRKHLGGSLPYVFTEQGIAGLAGVLKSPKAAEVHVKLMRAFVAMRHLLNSDHGLFQRIDSLEKRQCTHELKTDEQFEQVFAALEANDLTPNQGVFFNGQIFDAYVFINDLIRQAQKSIVLIDNYVDDSVLQQLAKRADNVHALILTKTISKALAQDVKKHNAQYAPITIKKFVHSHDRFLLIDDAVYHIGASLKDLGKKWFAFSKMERDGLTVMAKVEEVLDYEG